MASSALIGNLAVNLTMETASFQKGATLVEKRAAGMSKKVSTLGSSFKTFAIGFAGGIAAGMIPAISSIITNAFRMAASLTDAAEQVGVTVESLQELRFAATQAGVSTEQLEGALRQLTKNMGELQLGNKSITAAFASIGLSADDLKGKLPDQALRIVADALNKIPDPASRVAIGQKLMGEGFSKLQPLLKGGSAALDDYAEKARKAGLITTEEAAKLNDAANKWDAFKARVSVATAKIIVALSDIDSVIRKWWKFRDQAIASFRQMRDGVIKSVVDMVTGIGTAVTGRLNAIWNGVKDKIDSVTGWFRDMYVAVVGRSYVPDMVEEIGLVMAKLEEKMVDPAKKAVDRTKELFEELRNNLRSLLGQLYPEVAEDNRLAADIDTLERAMAKGLITARQYSDAMERLGRQSLQDVPILEGKSTSELADDMLEGIGELAVKIPEFGDAAKRTTEQVIDGFGRMAVGVIGSVRAMVDTFKAGDVLSGIQQFLSLILNVIQSLGQLGVIKLPASTIPTPRASGGPVSPGRSYLVGENGPEVVTFGRRGYVSPNKGNSGQMRIQINPSPYFDVVVDGRARDVAAPMAGQAAIMGAAGAQHATARRVRRSIP